MGEQCARFTMIFPLMQGVFKQNIVENTISNHPTLATNLKHYYKFDGNANDSVGNLDGNVLGATQTTGKIGNAYDFDGVNDYIISNSNIGITGSQNRSVSIWIKTTDTNSAIALSWGNRNSNGNDYRFDFNNNSRFLISLRSGNRKWDWSNNNITPNDGNWHHIVLVLDGTTNSDHTLYYDGSELTDTEDVPQAVNTADSPLDIARQAQELDYFNGKIDEIGIWDRALNSSEVSDLYNSGAGLPYD